MEFNKNQKLAIGVVGGLLGLSWYMGNQFEKADMMRAETSHFGGHSTEPICTTYACRTEIGGTHKGSDAMRFLAFLNEVKRKARISNISYEHIGDEGAFGVVVFKFDICKSGYKPTIAQVKAQLDGLRNGMILRGADYEDLHRPIETLAEGDEPNEEWYMGAETFEASNTKKPKLTPTQLKTLNMMKASTFYGGDRGNATRYAYVEIDNRGWKPYTTRPVQALIDKGIVTIGGGSRKFYGRVESMEAYHVYLNPVAWEYPFQYDSDKSLSQVGDKIVQNAKVRQQQHARILKQKQDEENMTLEEVLDELFGAETFDAEALARDWKWKGIGWTPEEEATLSREEKESVAEQLYNDWRAGKIKATDVDEYYERLENGAETFKANKTAYQSIEEIQYDFNVLWDAYNKLFSFIYEFSDMGDDYVTEKGKKYIENHMTIYHAEEYVAETMTPSEVEVKVTKDVTPKGSKIVVEECVDIQAKKADTTSNFYRVRFRDPADMSNFRVPAWAARAANTMGSKYYDVAGSKVTMGQDKSGNWKIQSVMIPKRANVDVDLALKIANHIQDRLEKEGKWAPKKCQDNERVLVIR